MLKPFRVVLPLLALLFIFNNASATPTYELNEIPTPNSESSFGYMSIVFFADGYTTAQKSQFVTNANALRTELLKISPYKEYRNFFRFYTVFIASNQSGISHPHNASDCAQYSNVPTLTVDNALGTHLDGGFSHLILGIDHPEIIQDILTEIFPDHYGSTTSVAHTAFVPVVVANVPFDYNSRAVTAGNLVIINNDIPIFSAFTLAHELGHALGYLGDEYVEGERNCGINRPNVLELQSSSDPISWRKLMHKNVPIPTPNGSHQNEIGVFPGAHCSASSTDWYKPADNCRMRHSDEANFCAVCMTQLVNSFRAYSNKIKGCYHNFIKDDPSDTPIPAQVRSSEKITFSAITNTTDYKEDINNHVTSTPAIPQNIKMCSPSNSISTKVLLDGQTVLGKEIQPNAIDPTLETQFEVDGSKLTPGHHQLTFNPSDSSIFAKNYFFTVVNGDDNDLRCNFDIEVVP